MPKNSTAGKYLVGHKINHWTFLESPKNNRHKIRFRCDCGEETITKAEHVISENSIQCRSCSGRLRKTVHGGCLNGKRIRLNSIWSGMLSRCNSPNGSGAHIYHDRGIRVCEEWKDFVKFRDWALNNGYDDELTLDRKDNDKGYSSDNCRWVTTKIQNRNKRDMKFYEAFGESKLLVEWAEDDRCIISYNRLLYRMKDKWPMELALVTPVNTVINREMLVKLRTAYR